MANFCGKCGNRTDPATGLCPVCDKEKINNQPEVVAENAPAEDFFADKPQEAVKSKNGKKKGKKFKAIIAVICSICIIVSAVFIFTNNDVSPKTESSKAVLSPESAVDIYMANKSVWMKNPEDGPDGGTDFSNGGGWYYCLLDLDFDGVLELIHNTTAGTGHCSFNSFYKINIEKLTVEEFDTGRSLGEGLDYADSHDEAKLLKNSSNGNKFYVFKDLDTSGNYGCNYYYEVYIKNGKLYKNPIFYESWEPDPENYGEKIYKYAFDDKEVSKTEYDKKIKEFYTKNIDLNLSWNYVIGSDLESKDSKTQKQLLLEAYRSFSYDGFSFDKVKTYDLSANDLEKNSQNITDSDITDEYLPVFEEMINLLYFCNDIVFEGEYVDLEKLSNRQVLEEYILTARKGFPVLAQRFSKYWKEYDVNESYKEDPKKEFLNYYEWYEFDADSIDWILTNVFGKVPDRSLAKAGEYYYHGNKAYCSGPEGGDSVIKYNLQDHKYIGGGKYEIIVGVGLIHEDSNYFYMKIVASPHEDPKYGKYWKFYSYKELEEYEISSQPNSSTSSKQPEDLSKQIVGEWHRTEESKNANIRDYYPETKTLIFSADGTWNNEKSNVYVINGNTIIFDSDDLVFQYTYIISIDNNVLMLQYPGQIPVYYKKAG